MYFYCKSFTPNHSMNFVWIINRVSSKDHISMLYICVQVTEMICITFEYCRAERMSHFCNLIICLLGDFRTRAREDTCLPPHYGLLSWEWARWVTQHHPKGCNPAIAIGSSDRLSDHLKKFQTFGHHFQPWSPVLSQCGLLPWVAVILWCLMIVVEDIKELQIAYQLLPHLSDEHIPVW